MIEISGVQWRSRSVRAEGKVVAGSAATMTCSAIMASKVGIVDSMNIRSVADVVIAPLSMRRADNC